jgi:hypothetical protein
VEFLLILSGRWKSGPLGPRKDRLGYCALALVEDLRSFGFAQDFANLLNSGSRWKIGPLGPRKDRLR